MTSFQRLYKDLFISPSFNTQVTLHKLCFALGTSQNTPQLRLSIAKVEIFEPQHTSHKEPRTVQGQDKHWRKCKIQTFQMLRSDWLLRHIFWRAQSVEYKYNLSTRACDSITKLYRTRL